MSYEYDWEHDGEYDPAAVKAELYASLGCLALAALVVALLASGAGVLAWWLWHWWAR